MRLSLNNTLAALIFILMLFSIISNVLINYHLEKKYFITTGKASITEGIVAVNVTSVSTPAGGSTSSGGGGAGGGGGGGAPPLRTTLHILDFTKNDEYIISILRGDTILVIFDEEKNYTLSVIDADNTRVGLHILEVEFFTSLGEISYLDLDTDKFNDLSILYDGLKLKFKKLNKPEKLFQKPSVITEKYIEETGIEKEKPEIVKKKDYLFLIIVSILVIVAIILYAYSKKMESIEKTQKKPIIKVVPLENEVGELKKKLDILKESYRNGYISKESYEKDRLKLERLIQRKGKIYK